MPRLFSSMTVGVLGGLVIIMAGCAHEGVVINKEIKPLQCYVRSEPLILGSGQLAGAVPVLYYDTAYNRIDIRRKDGVLESYYTKSRVYFDIIHVGDYIKVDKKYMTTNHAVINLRLTEEEFDSLMTGPLVTYVPVDACASQPALPASQPVPATQPVNGNNLEGSKPK